MKVVHWTMKNGSGMFRVAESLAAGERKIGLDSVLAHPEDPKSWVYDADVVVSHTHYPEDVRVKSKAPIVWVGHGSPDHVFQTSVEIALGYGHSDSWMLCQDWLRRADAMVTFWPRHHKIWQSMCHKGRKVDLVTLGVDKSFWTPTKSQGKFEGTPSLFTCENAHYVKWPLDLVFIWPEFRERIHNAKLHLVYLPNDQHRWWFPLMNANGCSYSSYITAGAFSQEFLRNAFNSVDFHIGLVKYGEYNRVSLEANASGCKTISYAGNPYSDFWITEGNPYDYLLPQLEKILKGETEPREKSVVPDISETVSEMKAIYDRL